YGAGKHLFGEIGERHWDRHRGLRLLCFASQAVFTIDPHRRAHGIGDPVERDIGKKGVAIDCGEKIAVVVRALLKYVHYPGGPSIRSGPWPYDRGSSPGLWLVRRTQPREGREQPHQMRAYCGLSAG